MAGDDDLGLEREKNCAEKRRKVRWKTLRPQEQNLKLQAVQGCAYYGANPFN
jgi:hypothetical protein